MAKQSKKVTGQTVIDVSDLPAGREVSVSLVPDSAQLAEGAAQLDVLGLQKLRLEGRLVPEGRKDWTLRAKLGATVTQACVVTLAPVRTRIEEDVLRKFVADWQEAEGDSVVEMDEDVESEPLTREIDLMAIALEGVALAMPDYPRAGDADLGEAVFAEPGVEAMTDEAAKPFAGLAALKAKMEE